MGIPPDAVQAGYDIDGAPIYVGRSSHNGDLIPAKVIPCRNVAFVPYGGREIGKHHYEVMYLENRPSIENITALAIIIFNYK